MKHFLSESEALKSLNITGFDQIDIGNFMKFVRLFEDLEPEIAKIALSQINDFARLVMSTLEIYKHNFDRSLDCIMRIHSDYDAFCSRIIDILAAMSEDPNASFEDKAVIIRTLLELESRRAKLDREYVEDIKEARKECNTHVGGVVKTAVAVVLLGTVTILFGTRRSKNES